MNEAVQVSIYCLAYNHEKYIRKTLEGFVNQKTNFRFKVIIHEDASTDSTAEILREYEEKYPELFDVIYQTENQYYKCDDIFGEFMRPLHEGKYVAFCEGDDYWCDENKLQKQYDIMEQNPDMAVCWHRVGLVAESGEPLQGTYPVMKLDSGFLSSNRFVECVCSDFFQMSSCFCREDVDLAYSNIMPTFAVIAEKAGIGDIPWTLFTGIASDKVYFFDEIMSCYRVSSDSSTMRHIWEDREKTKEHYDAMLKMMDSFDLYTKGRYHSACVNFREMKTFECFAKQKDIIAIVKNPWCWRRFWKLSLRAQASIAVKGLLIAIKNR